MSYNTLKKKAAGFDYSRCRGWAWADFESRYNERVKNPHNYVNDSDRGYWNKAKSRAAAAKSASSYKPRPQQAAPVPSLKREAPVASSSSNEEDEAKRLALHRAYVVGNQGSPRKAPSGPPGAKRIKLMNSEDAF